MNARAEELYSTIDHVTKSMGGFLWELDLSNGRITFVSDSVERFAGRAASDVLLDHTALSELISPEHRGRTIFGQSLSHTQLQQLASDEYIGEPYKLVGSGDSPVWLRDFVLDCSGAPLVRGTSLDVTEIVEKSSCLELLEELLFRILKSDGRIISCVTELARLLCERFGWAGAQLFKMDSSGNEFFPEPSVFVSIDAGEDFEFKSERQIRSTRDILWKASSSKELEVVEDLSESPSMPRAKSLLKAGFLSICAVPLVISESVTLVLELYSRDTSSEISRFKRFSEFWRPLIEAVLRPRPELLDLRVSESDFQVLLDAIPALVWFKDSSNRILAVNEYAARMTGLRREEIVDTQTEDLHPGEAAQYHVDDLEVIRTGTPKRKIIEQFETWDDRKIWVSTDKVPYVREGKVVGTIVFSLDISELKHTEHELRAIKRELESEVEEQTHAITTANIFFTLSKELLAIADFHGYFKRLNPAWSEKLGYSTEELLSRPYVDFVHPDDFEVTKDAGQKLVDAGQIREFENRYVTKDGGIRWLRWSATTLDDSIYAVAYDVTDRKKAELELLDLNAKFKHISKHIPGVIYQFVVKKDGTMSFPYISDGCKELFGYRSEEIVADSSLAIDCIHKDDLPLLLAAIEHSTKQMSVFRFEGRIVNKHGRKTYIRASSTPELMESGDILFNGLLMDITDLMDARLEIEKLNQDLAFQVNNLQTANEDLESLTQQLEFAYDQALEASKLKSEFLANISHEVRTPISAVIGMSELLLDTSLELEQQDYVNNVLDSASSLLRIINDVLDFSKIEADKIELETIDFDLRHLVEGCADLFAREAQKKEITMHTFVDPGLTERVVGDPTRIRQILMNFISNAVKFTDSGEIFISARQDPSQSSSELATAIRFETTDSGIGISPEVRGRLFKPFVQADGSTTRRFGGTGLGLSISRRLVELMDGQMGMESKEGVGSTFWFTVSLDNVPDSGETRIDIETGSVLLLSTRGSTRLVLEKYVKHFGLDFTVVDTLGKLIYELDNLHGQGRRVAGVVLESVEGGSSMASVLALLRKERRHQGVNLIVLLDLHQKEQSRKLRREGASHVLYKPVHLFSILRCLLPAEGSHSDDISSSELPIPVLNAGSRLEAGSVCGKVLVVEDNELIAKVVRMQLLNFGFEVDLAVNGKGAVELFDKNGPDYSLVLMDCQMPEMDGFETTHKIRKLESVRGGHVPIVALTAFAMSGDRERCIAAGMDDYLAKPVRQEDLEELLNRWLPEIFSASSSPDRVSPRGNRTSTFESGSPDDLLNIGRVKDLYGSDVLEELLVSFRDEVGLLVVQLQSPITEDSLPGLERVAHQLKGVAGVVMAEKLEELANGLQRAARKGELAAARTLSGEVKKRVYDLTNFINKLLQAAER